MGYGCGFQLRTDVAEKSGIGVDVDDHIEDGGDSVHEDPEKSTDFEAALVDGGYAMLRVCGVSR